MFSSSLHAQVSLWGKLQFYFDSELDLLPDKSWRRGGSYDHMQKRQMKEETFRKRNCNVPQLSTWTQSFTY